MLYEQQLRASVSGIDGLEKLEQACEHALLNWGVANPAFLFALHEALINAFEANCRCGRSDAFLSATLRLNAEQLTAEIPDHGPGCRKTGGRSAKVRQCRTCCGKNVVAGSCLCRISARKSIQISTKRVDI